MNVQFYRYVAAAYPILWITTHEYNRAIKSCIEEVDTRIVKKTNKNFNYYSWDVNIGITNLKDGSIEKDDKTPTAPIKFMNQLSSTCNIIFVKHYHSYIDKPIIWGALLNASDKMRKRGNVFVIISAIRKIPIEISKYISTIDFKLPSRDQLKQIVDNFEKDFDAVKIPKLSDDEKNKIIDHGVGLTSTEFESAFSIGLSDPRSDKSQIIYEQKKQLIHRTGLLKIEQSTEHFDTLIGLDNMKLFTTKMVNSKIGRGILIVGIQGAGKSEFAKRLGNEVNRPVIKLDFGNLMNSYVGKTEERTQQALNTIDAMEPAILFVDEFEKGLAGVQGSSGDSGVAMRQGQQFLTWLSDHKTDVYVVATANDISKLPPEYLRAERWDAIFFVDFPTREQGHEIFNVYKQKYNLIEDASNFNFSNWTGAEIKTLCRISAGMNISLNEASKYVTNITKVDADKIIELQRWAKDRAIPANIESFNEEKQLNNIIITE
jgi:AAA+ superfamily predicted ATPase